ncbi:hypothetical protein AGMMS50239_27190 [Bacteroidia bacterium]|nr:hypothetical protein AGMMS50239_27190 [Bacteroidia bacterium]
MVVYHGTRNGTFTEFKSKVFKNIAGFFTISKNLAEIFEGKSDYNPNPNRKIFETYLDFKNPLDITQIKDGYKDLKFDEFYKSLPFELSEKEKTKLEKEFN